jgi:hypothetical protein
MSTLEYFVGCRVLMSEYAGMVGGVIQLHGFLVCRHAIQGLRNVETRFHMHTLPSDIWTFSGTERR